MNDESMNWNTYDSILHIQWHLIFDQLFTTQLITIEINQVEICGDSIHAKQFQTVFIQNHMITKQLIILNISDFNFIASKSASDINTAHHS